MSAMQIIALGLSVPACIAGVLLLLAVPLRLQRLRAELDQLADGQKRAREWTSAEMEGMKQALTHIARLQRQVQVLEQRLEEVSLQGGDARPYQQAIRMVQRGASVEDLVADCELSPAEAELIISLHGPDHS